MIFIVDYNAGNSTSVLHAVQKLGHSAEITSDPERLKFADKLIFPGVGAAKATMENLKSSGLAEAIVEAYRSGKPLLGICIGIQVLFDRSEEEDTECLGIFPGVVKRFDETEVKVPQIGWNEVELIKSHWFFEGIPDRSHFYFVNSYYPVPKNRELSISVSDYGSKFCSAIAHENLVATQFHLEKSGKVGLKLLENFLSN